jgi:SAM-dependent methyltransferase
VLTVVAPRPELAAHPDRLRWNAKYLDEFTASFLPHPLAERALSLSLPAGPVLDLASGPSGSTLLAAAAGRRCVAVDASDVALGLLAREAERRGLAELIGLVHGDLGSWRPEPASYALVLCTGFWDRALFGAATAAVMPGGLLGWEAFTAQARLARPSVPSSWCLAPGEPARLLPDGFSVLEECLPGAAGSRRRLLARRQLSASVLTAVFCCPLGGVGCAEPEG